MDFLARQLQRDRAELLTAVKPETPVPVQSMETDLAEGWTFVTYTKPQRRWKRLVTLLTISQVHVLTGLILEMVEAAWKNRWKRRCIVCGKNVVFPYVVGQHSEI